MGRGLQQVEGRQEEEQKPGCGPGPLIGIKIECSQHRDKDPERKVWASKIRTVDVVRGQRGMGIRGGMGNREGGREGRKD